MSNSLYNLSIHLLIPYQPTPIRNNPPPTKTKQTIFKLDSALHVEKRGLLRGRMVDENPIVLRKRIREMKMTEARYEPPAHWMAWEKNCYAGKDEFVCELLFARVCFAKSSVHGGWGTVSKMA